MKNFLAIDTSSPILSVAIKAGKKRVSESKIVGYFKHAENLMPVIDRLLKKHHLTLQDMDAYLIDQGPGSFTGLRIGFAALKGFLAFEKKPCFGAQSLDIIAENITLPEGSHLAVALDARRDQFYIRFYCRKQKSWQPETALEILTLEQMATSLSRYDSVALAGDALTRHDKIIKNKTSKKTALRFLPETLWYPKASTLIRWMESPEQAFKNGSLQKLQKTEDFLPLYFRLSEAEEKTKAYASHH